MSGGEVSRLSNQDLQVVKNLIERCLQLHMSRKEVVSVLSREANVMPSITELLWQRLEEENQEFFEVYHIRLALKEQINRFNELLRQQAVLMGKLQPSGVVPLPVSNGSRVAQFQQNADGYAIDQTRPSMRPESLHPPLAQTLPGSFANGVLPLQTPTPFNLTTPPTALDCLPDTFSNSVRLMHGLNGGVVKSESDYPSNSIFYSAEPNLGEAHGSIEDGSIAAYGGLQASSQPLNETLLDVNGSYGHLGQIPKNFSLPGLAYHNYPNAFMTETENFLNSQDRGEIPDENKVAITDSYGTYEEFGSE